MNQSNARNELVDVMRGVSILLVLILHFQIAYRLDQGFFATLLSEKFVRAVARNGNYGVTIFFVISGFLITSTALSRFGDLKNVRLPAFYSFRFARIAPNLALILVVVVPLAFAGVPGFANKPGSASLGATVFSLVTFSHNVMMQEFGYFNYCLNILWSLSVEEMFYFTFPLVCVLLRKDALIISLWTLVAIFAPIQRFHYRNNEIVALYGYMSCFDGIAIGCITAVLGRRLTLSAKTIRWTRYIAIGVIVFVYLYKDIMANVVFGVTVVALSSGVILIGAKNDGSLLRPSGNVVSKAVGWLGKNSYELYLFHIVVLALMKIAVKRSALGYFAKPLWFALFLGLSALVAGCISRFYSEPMNRLLRQAFSSAYTHRQTAIETPASKPST
jgi:peptidoglycan/LPS O-acetylase OafA/YrhL